MIRGLVLLTTGLDDHDVADRTPHHFPGDLPEDLAFLGAEAAVADDDEVRRVVPSRRRLAWEGAFRGSGFERRKLEAITNRFGGLRHAMITHN